MRVSAFVCVCVCRARAYVIVIVCVCKYIIMCYLCMCACAHVCLHVIQHLLELYGVRPQPHLPLADTIYNKEHWLVINLLTCLGRAIVAFSMYIMCVLRHTGDASASAGILAGSPRVPTAVDILRSAQNIIEHCALFMLWQANAVGLGAALVKLHTPM
jgi:hypothetical protein